MKACTICGLFSRPVILGLSVGLLLPNPARAFSITDVSLTPPSPIPAGIPLVMTVSLTAPSAPVWLYQPTTVSVQGNQVSVDLYPDSGMLTVIGHLSTNVDLGVLPAGKYDYEVRLHPAAPVIGGVLTNRGGFVILPEPLPALITITAPDPDAAEPGPVAADNSGRFTIHRSGNTNVALRVCYAIGGTAENGSDYATISNFVSLAAGQTETDVVIQPLPDSLAEGTETVVLRILEPLCPDIYPPPPECYQVGIPREATVRITDYPVNTRPVVSVVACDPVATEGTNCYRWPGWPTPLPITCRGTNTATFVVRRTGEVTSDLTVFYQLCGSASNGVDYALLPGTVVIPAGQRLTPIMVWPLDDKLPERIETVILGLIEPPYASPLPSPYVVGRPARAAAIIVDNDQPRPGTGRLPDRCFLLTQPGRNGDWFRIESSSNLMDWVILCTNSVTDGAIHFVDPDATDAPQRFYRALPASAPPAD